MDEWFWFVVGIAAGAVGTVMGAYAGYKLWIWRHL